MRYLIDKDECPNNLKQGREHCYSILYVCKNCGSELYWEYPYYSTYSPTGTNVDYQYERVKRNLDSAQRIYAFDPIFYRDELSEAQAEFNRISKIKAHEDKILEWKNRAERKYKTAFKNTSVCPICKAKLSKEKGYILLTNPIDLGHDWYNCDEWYSSIYSSWQNTDIAKQFKLMAQVRKKQEQECAVSNAAAYAQTCDLYVSPKDTSKGTEIQQDYEALKKYILNLIHLENNIYSLKQQLAGLYYCRLLNDRLIVSGIHEPAYLKNKQLDALRAAYENATKAVADAKFVELPEISVACPQKPSKPILGTPGLFNKKKVLAQNEALTRQYEADMEKYKKDVEKCISEKARLTTEAEKKRQSAIETAQNRADAAKKKLDDAKITVQNQMQLATARPIPGKAIKSILDKEITEAEELLKKTFATRNDLYAYDVIFGKYRDVVALSSFYEYLMSGRCTSLVGATGAYNIYEDEIRADRVIAQLDTVISSLEDIKQNQYMMYQELRSIRASLANLDSTMNKAITSIQSIEANTNSMNKYLDVIAQNSDVIAYNTAATAYYSKINAELTDTLCFLTALN